MRLHLEKDGRISMKLNYKGEIFERIFNNYSEIKDFLIHLEMRG